LHHREKRLNTEFHLPSAAGNNATVRHCVKSTRRHLEKLGTFPHSPRKLAAPIKVAHKMFATHRLLILLYSAFWLKMPLILALSLAKCQQNLSTKTLKKLPISHST
jgi:hypothetical protein